MTSFAMRFQPVWLFLAGFLLVTAWLTAWAQDDPADLDAEAAKQAAVSSRFMSVLEKSPRRGTAFDRVYGYHVEFGTLEKFVAELQTRTKDSPDDGTAWMVLGMVQAHRGQDADAVDAFRQAEAKRPTDPLTSYYLGQSLLLVGRSEEAVQALERALERKPERADLLEIFQQLGRMHQRAQRNEEALKVWARLEALFPDDPRVLEQIATTQVEEGRYTDALPRYQRLVQLVKDDYRKTVYRMEVAALKIRGNDRAAGITELESVLADLNPDGWLHREVRRRIEDVFLRSGDQDGLVKYYQGWLEKHGQDVDGMARLAKFLASSARVPEATEWLEKALKLAPKRSELRRAFISQLMDDQRYTEAVQQYALLSQSSPGDTDVLRDWGKAVLKDKAQDAAARNAEAARIWRLILTARPDDALTTAQVADLFRQSNMNEEAVALYEKAIALAPADPQYREYLGEFQHVLKQPEKALAIWKEIAAGERRTAVNLARLAEVLNTFGYSKESMENIAEAAKLDPKDLSLQLKAADYHGRGEAYDQALAYVAAAQTLAANDDERDAVLKQKIETLQSSRRLEDEIEALAKALAANSNAGIEDWLTLARYYEAERQWTAATEAITTALTKNPDSVPALSAAARIAEFAGDFRRAADVCRQLAAADRRSRGDHLMNVSRLESQLGRTDEALQAGRDLILAAPGNTDNYEFYAQLCFRLGRMDEGLDTIRKAVRINPSEPHLIMSLGAALSEQFKTDEAIQVYWQAFEKAESVEDRTGLIVKLTDLHVQLNQYDRLIERLERDRREEDQRRTMTICIAQAHQSSGDYGAARTELESLLSQDTRDTELLLQLSKLCEQGQDRDAAIDYQRQIVAIAPGPETEFRLATLLQTNGDMEPATEILVKLTRREEDPVRLQRSLDSLLSASSFPAVIAITEPLLRERRDDWELIYREGVAWAQQNQKAEAAERFQRILALNLPYDTLGARAADQFKQQLAKAKSSNLSGVRTALPTRPSPLQARQYGSMVRQAVGLDYDNYAHSMRSAPRLWTPDSFGQARVAALGWLLKFAQSDGQEEAFTTPIEQKGMAADAPREAVLDLLYLQSIRNKFREIFEISKRLARSGGPEEQGFFLETLSQRDYDPMAVRSSRDAEPKQTPLATEELDLMLACFEGVSKNAPKPTGPAAQSVSSLRYNASGGQYIYIASGSVHLAQVARELRLAGRVDQAEQFTEQKFKEAATVADLSAAISICLADKAYDRIPSLFERFKEAARAELSKPPEVIAQNQRQASMSRFSLTGTTLLQWIGILGEQKKNDVTLSVFDDAMALGIQEARIRRTVKKQGPPSPRQGSNYVMYWYGTQQSNVQLAYPQPNEYIDFSMLQMLRGVFEVFRRNDVESDFLAHLKKRAEESAPDDRLYNDLLYGYALWWQEDQQAEAIRVIARAADLLPNDAQFRLDLASLHESSGNFDEALAIVDSVTPRDQRLLQTRESMALQLAERLGDIERARAAAERLFGLRLDSDSQMALVTYMRRLGLQEMAEAIVSRIQRRSGNTPSSMLTLMTQYQGQGRGDLAEQLAHTILQRVPRPNSRMAAAIVSGRVSSGDAGVRQQALRLLAQTGAIKKLIERTETQLAASPKSTSLYEQLIEYYTAANERDKVQQLLKTAIEQRPDAVELRLTLANQLQSAGKAKEACDEYLAILEKRPELLSDDFYRVQSVFQQAKRETDLARILESMDLKRFRQPYYIIEVATQLLRNEASREAGARLFERCFNEFPTYRNNLISNLYDPAMFRDPKIFDLCCQCIIPNDAQVVAQPWYGFDQINSYSGNGQANGIVDRLLAGAQGSDKSDTLRKLVEDRLKTAQGWLGGKAILAMLDISVGKKDEGTAALLKLFPDEAGMKDLPQPVAWLIGQQLDQSESTRELAVKLLTRAAQSNDSGLEFEYTAGIRLVKLYQDRGEHARARELLMTALKPTTTNSSSDPAYQAYRRVQGDLSIANTLISMNYPADALRVYRDLVNHPERIEAAGAVFGNAPQQIEQYKSQAKTGLARSLDALKQINAQEAVSQLLAPGETEGKSAFDLLLIIPDDKQVSTTSITTPLSRLFESLAANEQARASVSAQIAEVRQKSPDDPSIAVLAVLWATHNDPQAFAKQVADLQELVRQHPLEAVPTGSRPNSRQRAEAARRIGLWLAARECLKRPEFREAGAELAEISFEGASRQLERNAAVAILYEWGKLALDAGDRDGAEKLWTRLLEFVTTRPKVERKNAPAGAPGSTPPFRDVPAPRPGRAATAPPAAAGGRPTPPPEVLAALAQRQGAATPPRERPGRPENTTPPLTISQFRLAMVVANTAADHKMPALSQKAVRDALAGGTPAADLAPAGNQGGAMGMMSSMRSLGGGSARVSARGQLASPDANDAISQEVASSLLVTIGKWSVEEFPPADVYSLVKPIVFPASRPTDILLYPDSSSLNAGIAKSLGLLLIQWGDKAGQLADLKQELAARRENPNSKIPATVLDIELALLAQDMKAASAGLQELDKLTAAATVPAMIQLAGHAAIHAFAVDELQADALPILKRLQQSLLSVQVDPNRPTESKASLGQLFKQVNRHLAKLNDVAGMKALYETYATTRQQNWSRYSGDYGAYQLSLDWGTIANDAASTSATDIALDYLGRVADVSFERYGSASTKVALAAIETMLRSRSPQQRYETWRDWTLPTPQRETIRLLFDSALPVLVPDSILKTSERGSPEGLGFLRDGRPLTNFTFLVDAAEAANALPDLIERLRPLHEKKSPFADSLLVMALARSGAAAEARPHIEELFKTRNSRLEGSENVRRTKIQTIDYLTWRAALFNPELADLAIADFHANLQSLKSNRQGMSSQQQATVYQQAVRDVASRERPADGSRPAFKHWVSAISHPTRLDSIEPWWTVSEGQAAHLIGPGGETLYFRYPLAGDFEFSVETSHGGTSRSMTGFNGMVFSPEPFAGGYLPTNSAVDHEYVGLAGALQRDGDSLHQIRIRSQGGRFTYFLNNQEAYTEDLVETSPWLRMGPDWSNIALFRSLKITGNPHIPREVSLISKDRMDGWFTQFYGESQPVHRTAKNSPDFRPYQTDAVANSSPAQTVFDWRVEDGILTGRARPAPEPGAAGWTSYHRPLQSKESVSLEFFYEPGKTETHPTFGRLAFLLDPAGVRTRWLVQAGWDDAALGIPVDNVVDETTCRRGDGPLPLKSGDWNTLKLSLEGDTLSIALNGTEIFQRAIEPNNSRCFGLYHSQAVETRVRKAILTGAWPETLTDEIRNDLLALSTLPSVKERQLASRILDEDFVPGRAAEIVIAARALDDAAAYQLLRDWVLPSDDHSDLRLDAEYSPRIASADEGKKPVEDGQSLCPAWELIQVAKRLQKLDEISAAVDALGTSSPDDVVRRLAMRLLVDVGQEQDEQATTHLAELRKLVMEGPVFSSRLSRASPDMTAISTTAQLRPALRAAADEFSRALLEKVRGDEKSSPNRLIAIEIANGEIRRQLAAGSPEAQSVVLRQWTTVPVETAASRGKGTRLADWAARLGSVVLLPGEAPSQLFFQSPLEGNFEVTAKVSAGKRDESQVAYGMISIQPNAPEFKGSTLYRLLRSGVSVGDAVTIPNFGDEVTYKITVDGLRMTTFVNDVRIHEHRFATKPAPWLVLQGRHPAALGQIRDLRITGSPQIPQAINLLEDSDNGAWKTDYYQEGVSLDPRDGQPNPRDGRPLPLVWSRTQEELIGSLNATRSGRFMESLVRYQRPMLEDGEIEFEAWYLPGEFEVHPAVGRTALLVSAEGVKRHTITDVPYDRTGLPTGNASAIEGAATSLPLKQTDWNRIRVSLKGDVLTLFVNDVEAARHPLTEPPAQRFFGLFRFSDQRKARVRNIQYRGHWPTTIPTVDEQELAIPAQETAIVPQQGPPRQEESRRSKDSRLQAG